MAPTIRIDDDLYEYLKQHAEPFVDTPGSVLRRLLDLPSPNGAETRAESTSTAPAALKPSKRRRAKRSGRPQPRAARGSLVPSSDYEIPILRVLADAGGRAPSREAIDALERHLADKLNDVDREPTSSGEIRWRNRAQFVRLALVKKGELAPDSPRGIWEITHSGRERLARESDDA